MHVVIILAQDRLAAIGSGATTSHSEVAVCARSALLAGSAVLLWSQAAWHLAAWAAGHFGPEAARALSVAGARGVAALGEAAQAASGWGWRALHAAATLVSSLLALAWEQRGWLARGARATWSSGRAALEATWALGARAAGGLRGWRAARRAECARARELAAASTALEYALVEMALAGGVAVGAADPCWVLLSRSGEWDEVLVFGQVRGADYSLGLTTDATGVTFAWVLVRLLPGHFRAVVVPGGGALRMPPFGVAGALANWVCEPPHAAVQWDPSAAELAALRLEAQGVDAALQTVAPAPGVVFDAGSQAATIPAFMPVGGPLPPVGGGAVVPAAAGAAGAAAAPPPAGAVALPAAGAAGPAAAAGLGFAAVGVPDGAAAAGPAAGGMDLASLLQEVRAIQGQLQGGGSKGSKKDKKDKKSDTKKRRRRKRRDPTPAARRARA